MNAPFLTPLAVQNMDVLEALGSKATFESQADLARHVGRDKSNLSKTLRNLVECGLLEHDGVAPVPYLTDAGTAALDAWARAQGEAPATDPAATPDLVHIPFDQLEPWPDQPRSHFDQAFIDELSISIADKGVLQPLIVRPMAPGDDGAPRYQVVIGENRRRAACLAVSKRWQPHDMVVPCRVRQLSDAEAFEIAVSENVQRDDLHWMDEARSLLRLAEMGRTAAQIERIFGGARGKRSIQDYTKIARELPADVLALAYNPPKLPNGEPNPACLTYVKARQMVGDKKPPAALDLSPLLAMTLAEILDAALGGLDGRLDNAGGRAGARLYKPPVGGPIHKLQEKKLLTCGFADGRMVAWVPLSQEVRAWLDQIGFTADPLAAVQRLQEAGLGPLQAARLVDGEYATAELNPPIPPPSGEVSAKPTEGALPDGPATPDAGPAIPAGRDLDNLEPWERRLVGAPPVASTPTPAPAPAAIPAKPLLPELPPILQIVLIEAAHKIAAEGLERGPGTWAARIAPDAYKDARGQTLVQAHRLIAFLPHGHEWLITVTKRGRDLLLDLGFDEITDRIRINDDQLALRQQSLLGEIPAGKRYSTYWLNPPADAVAVSPHSTPSGGGSRSEGGGPGEVSPEATEGVLHDEGSGEALPDAGEMSGIHYPPGATPLAQPTANPHPAASALQRADAVLDMVDRFLGQAHGNLTQANRAEAAQLRAMIASARAGARPYLPEV